MRIYLPFCLPWRLSSAGLRDGPELACTFVDLGLISRSVCCCSSVVERVIGNDEVESSILSSSTIDFPTSQVERPGRFDGSTYAHPLCCYAECESSILSSSTINFPTSQVERIEGVMLGRVTDLGIHAVGAHL